MPSLSYLAYQSASLGGAANKTTAPPSEAVSIVEKVTPSIVGTLKAKAEINESILSPSEVFVMETVSVIMQVASFKLTGKRIFRMAPLHHHFELKGWPEPRVIVRFWIVTVILVLVGIATLKIR